MKVGRASMAAGRGPDVWVWRAVPALWVLLVGVVKDRVGQGAKLGSYAPSSPSEGNTTILGEGWVSRAVVDGLGSSSPSKVEDELPVW
jgi:hypothetical protein